MSGKVNSTGAVSGIIGTTVGSVTASSLGALVSTDLGWANVQMGTKLSAANNANATDRTFTGIPAWHSVIYLFHVNTSQNSSGHMIVRLGYGSTTYQTSGYSGCTINGIGSSDEVQYFKTQIGDTGRRQDGAWTFIRQSDTTYHMTSTPLAHPNVPAYVGGMVVMSGGPCTALKVSASTGGWDAQGDMYAGWA
jgi:hypothetical protein